MVQAESNLGLSNQQRKQIAIGFPHKHPESPDD